MSALDRRSALPIRSGRNLAVMALAAAMAACTSSPPPDPHLAEIAALQDEVASLKASLAESTEANTRKDSLLAEAAEVKTRLEAVLDQYRRTDQELALAAQQRDHFRAQFNDTVLAALALAGRLPEDGSWRWKPRPTARNLGNLAAVPGTGLEAEYLPGGLALRPRKALGGSSGSWLELRFTKEGTRVYLVIIVPGAGDVEGPVDVWIEEVNGRGSETDPVQGIEVVTDLGSGHTLSTLLCRLDGAGVTRYLEAASRPGSRLRSTVPAWPVTALDRTWLDKARECILAGLDLGVELTSASR